MNHYVITRTPTDNRRTSKDYWCTYASGDRWNARPSHAKKFNTEEGAENYARLNQLIDYKVEIQK